MSLMTEIPNFLQFQKSNEMLLSISIINTKFILWFRFEEFPKRACQTSKQNAAHARRAKTKRGKTEHVASCSLFVPESCMLPHVGISNKSSQFGSLRLQLGDDFTCWKV